MGIANSRLGLLVCTSQNQSRLSAQQAAETLVPDSSLMQRMRATYSLPSGCNKSISSDSEGGNGAS